MSSLSSPPAPQTQTSFDQGSPDWLKWRARALGDLYFFADVILGYGSKVPISEDEHRLMCRFVERKTGNPQIDSAPYHLILVPREVGKCQTASTEVLTSSGEYLRTDQLRVNHLVLSMTDRYQFVWRPIMAIERQGVRPVYRITLRTGRVLTVTGNHPIRMLREWRRADAVVVGDRVACPRTTPCPDDALTIPDEAAFLGFMVGDGNCPGALLTNADLGVIAAFERAVERLGGTSRRRKSPSRATDVLTQGLRPVLRHNGLGACRSAEKFVPARVFRSDNPSCAAFLRALFSCDGTVERANGLITYSTVSERLGRDVQRLLLRFGITSRMAVKRGRYKGQPHYSWRLSFGGRKALLNFEAIGFIGKRQPLFLKALAGTDPKQAKWDTLPPEWRSLLPRRPRGIKDGNGLRGAHGIRIDNSYATSWPKALAACVAYDIPDVAMMEPSVYWDTVRSVEVLPPEQTFGIEVLDTHVYCAEDVVTHNTTVITQARPIQLLCANPNTSILIGNEKEDNAKLMLAEIKRQFESNELLRALFPEVIPPDLNDTVWSATKIIVNREGRKEPSVFVTGESGTVTGMHPDHIFIDDMLSKEAMENARVGDAGVMQRVNRWINTLPELLSSNAKPFPTITWTGTRWWTGDSYEYVEQTFGHGEQKQYVAYRAKTTDGRILSMPVTGCYRVGDLAVYKRSGYEDGKAAFPSKWPEARMTKKRFEDPAGFACQVQNDPSDDAVAIFKQSWLRYFTWLDPQTVQFTDMAGKKKIRAVRDLDIMAFVDPGGFGANNVEDRARAAILVTGSTGTGEQLLLEAWSERDTFLDAIRKVIEFASKYEPRKIVVELAGQQAAFIELLRQTAQKAGVTLSLQVEKPGLKAKANRILELEPYFQQGHIYISRSPQMAEFGEQYQRFPRTVRVDLLDALAYGPRFWRRESVRSTGPQIAERRAQELATYRERRGLK